MGKIKTGSTRCTNTPNDFYKFVKIVNGCWEWQGTKDGDGYGFFTCERVRYRAHRWIFEQSNSLPQGMLVCHICDTPSCVKPMHLYAGTHRDNINDAYRRKRKIAPYYQWEVKRDPIGRFTKK
tara:strand:- start:206 stop:574 length:369 start_codon:yes stop_codon:yes gene_type:complete